MFQRPARSVSRVFIHCSASNYPEHSNIETITQWHLERGFSGVGYHYFIGFDGKIEPGRDLERIPAAQAGHNRESIAICLAGGQDNSPDAFTPDQFKSLKALCQAISQAYGNRITFHGHQEVSEKACPVFDYVSVLCLSERGYLRQPRQSLAQSRTLKGSRVTSVGAGLSAALAVLEPHILSNHKLASGQVDLPEKMSPIQSECANWGQSFSSMEKTCDLVSKLVELAWSALGVMPWLALLLIMIGVTMVLYARLDDHERGLR